MKVKDSSYVLQEEERELLRLAEASRVVSEQLSHALETVKARNPMPGKWKNFRTALKHCWSQDKIEELEVRVDGLRKQLNIQLLVTVRYAL